MHGRRLRFVPVLLGALAPFVLLATVLRRAVDVPFYDEWDWADLVYAAHTHTLTLAQLWQPHAEHRIFISNVLMLGMSALGGWQVIRQQIASVLFLACTQLFLWQLLRRTIPVSRQGACFLATTVVLFGFAQYENLEWGFQMAWFLCNLGLVIAVWALTRPQRATRDTLLAIVAATIASLSSSQGLFIWGAGLIAIVAMPRSRIRTGVAWVVGGLIVTIVVRSGMAQYDTGHVGMSQANLLLRFVPTYLGASIAASFAALPSLAAGVLVLVALALFALLAARGSLVRLVRLAPWLALASYAVFGAGFTALNRAGFGVDAAMTSRYATISEFAWIAAIACTFATVARGKRGFAIASLPVAAVVAASVVQSVAFDPAWRDHSDMLKAARAQLAAGDRRAVALLGPSDPVGENRISVDIAELARAREGIFSGL